jgi:hypothetical protein
MCCPACEGPIPDLLGELTEDPAAVNVGKRSTDCYYCGVPLVSTGPDDLRVSPTQPPSAVRTLAKRDLKFGGPRGVDDWVADMEKALADEAKNSNRDPRLPAVTRTRMVNKYGKRAFEGYSWYVPSTSQQTHP